MEKVRYADQERETILGLRGQGKKAKEIAEMINNQFHGGSEVRKPAAVYKVIHAASKSPSAE